MSFEGYVCSPNNRMVNRKEEVPLCMQCLLKRIGGRKNLISGGGFTCIEKDLTSACEKHQRGGGLPRGVASRKTPVVRPRP